MKLPRWYGFLFKVIKIIKLYVFTDASWCSAETAAYFHFIQEHNVKCMFIALKLRLVLLSQKASIPRLELQAAAIATRIKNTTVNEISI